MIAELLQAQETWHGKFVYCPM